MWAQPISSDTALLSIPLNALASLPQGASYQAKQGRVNVKASLKPADEGKEASPTILIEASCDSLQRLWLYQEARADSLQRQADWMIKQQQESVANDIRTLSERPPNGICVDVVIIAACVMVGLFIMYLTKKKTE